MVMRSLEFASLVEKWSEAEDPGARHYIPPPFSLPILQVLLPPLAHVLKEQRAKGVDQEGCAWLSAESPWLETDLSLLFW